MTPNIYWDHQIEATFIKNNLFLSYTTLLKKVSPFTLQSAHLGVGFVVVCYSEQMLIQLILQLLHQVQSIHFRLIQGLNIQFLRFLQQQERMVIVWRSDHTNYNLLLWLKEWLYQI